MNWVGGARNRIKLKHEQKLQKEFFERKRHAKKVLRSASLPPGEKCNGGVSQDLLALKVIMAAHDAPKKKDRLVKKPVLVNLDGPKSSRERLVSANIELPMSPGKPSKLQLVESPTAQRRDSDSSSNLLAKSQILKYEKEDSASNRRLQDDLFATYNQQPCNYTSLSQSQLNNTTGIVHVPVRNSREEKRKRNGENGQACSSQELLPPRKKYSNQSNDNPTSFMSINSVQDSTHLTKTSTEKELRNNNNNNNNNNNINVRMEPVPGSLLGEKGTVRSSAASTTESILSQERQSNCESQGKNLKIGSSDYKNENWTNFVALFEDRAYTRPVSLEATSCTVIQDKSPFVPYAMPGPLRSFLSKKRALSSKRDSYHDDRFDRHWFTTDSEDISSKSPTRRSMTNIFMNNCTSTSITSENSQTSLLHSEKFTDRVSDNAENLDLATTLRLTKHIEKRMSRTSGGSVRTDSEANTEASGFPEKRGSLDTGDRMEVRVHDGEWRKFVMTPEITADCRPKEINPKCKDLVQDEEIADTSLQPSYVDSVSCMLTEATLQPSSSNTNPGNGNGNGNVNVEISENSASEALEEVMDLDRDLDSYSESSYSSTWSSSASGGDGCSQDQTNKEQTKPGTPKEEPSQSTGVKIRKALGFKYLPRPQHARPFNCTDTTQALSSNWFRVHSGIKDDKADVSLKDRQLCCVSLSTHNDNKVPARRKDPNSAIKQNTKISGTPGLNDWKSPGARLLYCAETPSALISPAAVGDTVPDALHHSSLSRTNRLNTYPDPCITCNATNAGPLSHQGVPSTHIGQEQSVPIRLSEHTTKSSLMAERFGKEKAIETENTITSPNKTEEFTTGQTRQSTGLTSSKADATTSPIKAEKFTTEHAVQTEHTKNSPGKMVEKFSTERAIQTEHTTISPIKAGKCTTDQAMQTERVTTSPIKAEKCTSDQAMQTERVTTSPIKAEKCTTEQAMQTKHTTISPIKAGKCTTDQAMQTERVTTSPIKAEKCTSDQAMQTERVTTSPIKAEKCTSDQAMQTERVTTSPIKAGKCTSDQAMQTERVTTSPIKAEKCTTEQTMQTKHATISSIKTGKYTTNQAIQTERVTTSPIKAEECTTEQAMQTEPEPVGNSSTQNTLQQETQQLLKQITELRNTCLHQSLIIQAMQDRAKTTRTL